MQQFISKHQKDIIGMLSGWDRIRFRGTIRMLACVDGLLGWLSHRRVLNKNYKAFSIHLTDLLRSSVAGVATAAGRAIRDVASSSLSREELVQELLRKEGLTEGIVCVLSCVGS